MSTSETRVMADKSFFSLLNFRSGETDTVSSPCTVEKPKTPVFNIGSVESRFISMNHIPTQLFFFFLVPFLSTASSILADFESSKGSSAGTCGKIRLAYKIASLCLNDRSVFFRRLFLLAFPSFIGAGPQGFSKGRVFARGMSDSVRAQSDRDRGSRYRNGLSVVEPRAISPPMSFVFWFVTFSARVYELSYSLAFVDLKITTARLPAVRTAHDTAPAKANRPLRRVAFTNRATNRSDLSKSLARDMEASAAIYMPCFQRYMSCFNFPTTGTYSLPFFSTSRSLFSNAFATRIGGFAKIGLSLRVGTEKP